MPEWLTENKDRAYPFVSLATVGAELAHCVVDLVASYPDEYDQGALLLEYLDLGDYLLYSIPSPYDGLGTAAAEQAVVTGTILTGPALAHPEAITLDPDAAGDPDVEANPPIIKLGVDGYGEIFDSEADGATIAGRVTSEHIIIRWWTDTISVTIMLDRTRIADVAWPQDVSAYIVPSAYVARPDHLLQVNVEGESESWTILNDEVVFAEGYNCSLSQLGTRVSGGETQDRIQIAFIPGAGLGRYPSECDEVPYLLRINGVSPNDLGALTLSGDDCYLTRGIENGIRLDSYCGACCECDEYSDAYTQIKTRMLWAKNNIHTVLDAVNHSIRSTIWSYKSYQSSMEKWPIVLRSKGFSGFVVKVQTIIANSSSLTMDLGNHEFEWQFTVMGAGAVPTGATGRVSAGSGVAEKNSSKQYDDPAGTWPTYTKAFAPGVQLGPGEWFVYEFELIILDTEEREAEDYLYGQVTFDHPYYGSDTTLSQFFDFETDQE